MILPETIQAWDCCVSKKSFRLFFSFRNFSFQFPFWRKTRKPITDTNYIGTDCNRNFDHHWSSGNSRASKHTYRGEKPFSEPETEMLKTIMHSIKSNCKFYLSLHSYAKAFMYPWGYTKYEQDIKKRINLIKEI